MKFEVSEENDRLISIPWKCLTNARVSVGNANAFKLSQQSRFPSISPFDMLRKSYDLIGVFRAYNLTNILTSRVLTAS